MLSRHGLTGKHQIAARLTELSGGRVVVEHDPRDYISGRRKKTIGRQYEVCLSAECEEEIGLSYWLDDSRPESLKAQLVAGLREIAQELRNLAWEIESAGKPGRGIEGMEGGSNDE